MPPRDGIPDFSAASVVVERAAGDPWWAAVSAVRLWAGWAPAETVLADLAPGCAAALDAARPLAGEQAA